MPITKNIFSNKLKLVVILSLLVSFLIIPTILAQEEVLWSDYNLDLAIIQINVDRELEPIQLRGSNNRRTRDWAIATGKPIFLSILLQRE